VPNEEEPDDLTKATTKLEWQSVAGINESALQVNML